MYDAKNALRTTDASSAKKINDVLRLPERAIDLFLAESLPVAGFILGMCSFRSAGRFQE
jgi:hypothetical protein